MRYRLVKGLLLHVISFYRSCLRLKQCSLSTWSEVIRYVVITTSEVYATTFRYQISGGGWYDKKKHGMESLGWPQVRAVSRYIPSLIACQGLDTQLYHSYSQDCSPVLRHQFLGSSHLTRFYYNQFRIKAMLHKHIASLALLASAVIVAPAQCTPYERIDKRDCIVGLDGFCVDSIDYMGSSNDELLAFASFPTPEPVNEPLLFTDPPDTNLGGEGFGSTDSLFSDYNGFDEFQIAAGDRYQCTCPGDISTTKVSISFLPLPRRSCLW